MARVYRPTGSKGVKLAKRLKKLNSGNLAGRVEKGHWARKMHADGFKLHRKSTGERGAQSLYLA
jgi:hypothetical protein